MNEMREVTVPQRAAVICKRFHMGMQQAAMFMDFSPFTGGGGEKSSGLLSTVGYNVRHLIERHFKESDMSLLNVPAGKELPEDIYVVIEIPANADPIKYEVDKESGALFVDRFMSTAMFYPCNYGYINHTLSLDGDPVDVLVPTPYPLEPGSVIRCRPVGVLKMTDESGEDAKLVAVPHTKLSKEYDHIKDVNDLPDLLKAQITHFFEHYKDLESGKWVKVDGWDNADAAKAEIIASFERAQKK